MNRCTTSFRFLAPAFKVQTSVNALSKSPESIVRFAMHTRFAIVLLLSAARAGCQGVCEQGECEELSRGCRPDTYVSYISAAT